MKNAKISAYAVATLATAVAGQAYAATTLTWTGATDTSFTTPGNWSPAQTPVTGDTQIYNIATNLSVVFPITQTGGGAVNGPSTYNNRFDTNAGNFTFSGAPILNSSNNAVMFNILATATASPTVTVNNVIRAFGTTNGTFQTATPRGTQFANDGPNATLVLAGNIYGGSANGVVSPVNFNSNTTNTSTISVSGVIADRFPTLDGAGGANTTDTGVVSVIKNGVGFLTLSAPNTYSGGTTLNTGGTTYLTNTTGSATGSGAVTALNSCIVAGSGTVGGTLAISGTSSLRPGIAAGTTAVLTDSNATATAVVLGATSTSVFDVNGATVGTQYDSLNLSGGGTLTYGGALTINLNTAATGTYDLFAFTPLAQAGNFTSVTLAGTSGAAVGALTNTAGVFSATVGGNVYTFAQATGDLTVVPTPEPASLGLLALVGLTLGTRRRRTA